MDVIVNGEKRPLETGTTLEALITTLGFGHRRLAVEVNDVVVPRDQHPWTELHPGDVVEILHFVGGG